MRYLLWILLLIASPIVFGAAVDSDKQTITISIATEPPSLDSTIAEDGLSRQLIALFNEGLVRYDRRLEPQPAGAVHWEDRDRTMTFYLRKESKWSDGTPVIAHDYVYAWRRLVDPATAASGSTVLAWGIEGANEILKGERPPESLGVEAIDDYTLKVTKSASVPFLIQYLGSAPFYPLKRSFVEAKGDRFAAEAGNILFNGPFRLVEWKHGASLTLARNPTYWNSEETTLNAIDIPFVTSDQRTLMNLYTSDEIATFDLSGESLKDAAEAGIRMRQQRRTGCIALVTFNLREGRVTAKKAVRKAVQAVFDPETFANRIIAVPANTPAWSFFQSHKYVGDTQLHAAYPPPRATLDTARARQYIQQAKRELGALPTLILLSWEGQEKQVEYLQGLLKDRLGIDVRVDKQAYKQAIAKLIAGDFDLSLSRFCDTGRDPDFMADILQTGNSFNDGRFSNQEYDRLMAQTRATTDQAERLAAFGRMQDILFEEVPVLPTHEIGIVYAQKSRLVRVQRFPARNFARSAVR